MQDQVELDVPWQDTIRGHREGPVAGPGYAGLSLARRDLEQVLGNMEIGADLRQGGDAGVLGILEGRLDCKVDAHVRAGLEFETVEDLVARQFLRIKLVPVVVEGDLARRVERGAQHILAVELVARHVVDGIFLHHQCRDVPALELTAAEHDVERARAALDHVDRIVGKIEGTGAVTEARLEGTDHDLAHLLGRGRNPGEIRAGPGPLGGATFVADDVPGPRLGKGIAVEGETLHGDVLHRRRVLALLLDHQLGDVSAGRVRVEADADAGLVRAEGDLEELGALLELGRAVEEFLQRVAQPGRDARIDLLDREGPGGQHRVIFERTRDTRGRQVDDLAQSAGHGFASEAEVDKERIIDRGGRRRAEDQKLLFVGPVKARSVDEGVDLDQRRGGVRNDGHLGTGTFHGDVETALDRIELHLQVAHGDPGSAWQGADP